MAKPLQKLAVGDERSEKPTERYNIPGAATAATQQ